MAVLAGVLLIATGCYQDFDFSGDHRADRVVYDRHGTWTDLETGIVLFDGEPEDVPVPGDWNGDHLADAAVVTADGRWITRSARGTFSFPRPAELPDYASHFSLTILPVPGDYDGDGDLDPAWYRESDATWFIEGQAPVQFGTGPSALPVWPLTLDSVDYDVPVPEDYDGDGVDDLSVFSPVTGDWAVRASSTGLVSSVRLAGYETPALPVPADYDGLGRAQRAVYGNAGWLIEGHAAPDPFGAEPDGASWLEGYPAPADYDGDGRADLSYIDPDIVSDTRDVGQWYTKGDPDPVLVYGPDWDQWALASNYSVRANIARLLYLDCLVPDADC